MAANLEQCFGADEGHLPSETILCGRMAGLRGVSADYSEAMCPCPSALRGRRDDIPQLWDFFMDRQARQFGRTAPLLTRAALRALEQRARPGNPRATENRTTRILIFGDEGNNGSKEFRRVEFDWRLRSSTTETAAEGGIAEGLSSRSFRSATWNRRKRAKELKRGCRLCLYTQRTPAPRGDPRRRTRFPRPEGPGRSIGWLFLERR